MKTLIGIATALALITAVGSSMAAEFKDDAVNLNPTVNLSAVRLIECKDKKGYLIGSGSLIAKDTVLTALHVANNSDCVDVASGKGLRMYWSDSKHDLALMTGSEPDIPYIKTSCEPYKKGQVYMSYGISDYYRPDLLFREVKLVYKGHADLIELNAYRLGYFKGSVVPGMSGGPVIDLDGYEHGVNTAFESDLMGLPVNKSYSFELAGYKLCPKK